MKKLLRPRDILLLGLAGAIDVFNEFKGGLGVFGEAYKNIYGWAPERFKSTHHFQVLYHSLKTGYIEKVIKEGEVYLRLTSKGKELIERDFLFVKLQNKKWDGKWRVVIFDIKEEEKKTRDILRLKLRQLGFGMLQKSVWITPHDLALDFRQFVESEGLGEEVFVMEVSNLLAGDPKELAAKIWPIKKLNETYQEIYEILIDFRGRDKIYISKGRGKEEERGEKLRKVRSKFLEILVNDPMLPKELLPNDWYGKKVRELIKKIK